MIWFSIPYQGVVHDESSLHFKSTPIKEGLCIPLWDTFVDVRLEQALSPSFSFNKQRWHSQGLAKPECALLSPPAPRRCRSGFTLFIVSHMDTRTLTAASHRVYCAALHCLCQQRHVCEARYTKSVESCSQASEFICIHSTACLSSEPILITTSSGLLQQCTSSRPLSLEEEKKGCCWCILFALILLFL